LIGEGIFAENGLEKLREIGDRHSFSPVLSELVFYILRSCMQDVMEMSKSLIHGTTDYAASMGNCSTWLPSLFLPEPARERPVNLLRFNTIAGIHKKDCSDKYLPFAIF
jgi:hypothetical protein